MKFFNITTQARTVTIPIRIVDGKITYFYEGPLPAFQEGAMGDLILPEDDVIDRDWVAPLREERRQRLLEAKSDLMLAMRLQRIPPELRKETFEFAKAVLGDFLGAMNYRFVPAILTEPLDLLLRGTKRAILQGGACLLPTMEMGASSLNHAYSLVSEKYEPDRLSHTGNVFQRVYYLDRETNCWWPLENLRSGHEAKYEEERLLSKKQIAEKHAREKIYQKREAARAARLDGNSPHLEL